MYKSYSFQNYIFNVSAHLSNIFNVSNNTLYFNKPEEIEICQIVKNNDFGGLREIYINKNSDNFSVNNSSSELLFIPKDRFLSFINGDVNLKNFFIINICDQLEEVYLV